jgi:hypothetical protein
VKRYDVYLARLDHRVAHLTQGRRRNALRREVLSQIFVLEIDARGAVQAKLDLRDHVPLPPARPQTRPGKNSAPARRSGRS